MDDSGTMVYVHLKNVGMNAAAKETYFEWKRRRFTTFSPPLDPVPSIDFDPPPLETKRRPSPPKRPAKKYPLVSETNTQQDIEMPFCSDGSLGIDLTTTLRIIRVHRADADQITLRAGHRILKVNGTDVSNRKDMIQEVKSHLKEHTKDVPLQLFVEDEGLAL